MAWNLKEEATKLEKQLENGCFKEKLSAECHLLGRFFEIVQQDETKAANVYQFNCHDYADSCYRFAQLCHGKGNHQIAFDYNRKACQLGHSKSCLDAGLASLSNNLEGCVGENLPMAVDFLERSCQLGSGFGCYMLAGVYMKGVDGIVDQNLSAALKYDFQACQLNFPLACANLNGTRADDPASNGILWRAAHVKSLYGSQTPQTFIR